MGSSPFVWLADEIGSPRARHGCSGTPATGRRPGAGRGPVMRSMTFWAMTEPMRIAPITPVWVLPPTLARPEAVAQVEHDEHGEQHAAHPARAAEDAHAAEQHDRDDLQLEPGRHVAAHGAEAGGEEDPASPGDERRREEQPEPVRTTLTPE